VKATELINKIQNLVDTHGDLPIYINQTIDHYNNMLAMDVYHRELGICLEFCEDSVQIDDDEESWIDAIVISDEP
jgi:hypothetical protein